MAMSPALHCCRVDWGNNEPHHRPVWFPLETAERESDPHTALAPTNSDGFTPPVWPGDSFYALFSLRVHLSTVTYHKFKKNTWHLAEMFSSWLSGHTPRCLSWNPFPLMSILLLLKRTNNSHETVLFQGKVNSALQFAQHIDHTTIRQLARMNILCATMFCASASRRCCQVNTAVLDKLCCAIAVA